MKGFLSVSETVPDMTNFTRVYLRRLRVMRWFPQSFLNTLRLSHNLRKIVPYIKETSICRRTPWSSFYFSFQYSIRPETHTIMFNDLDDNIIRDIKLPMALKQVWLAWSTHMSLVAKGWVPGFSFWKRIWLAEKLPENLCFNSTWSRNHKMACSRISRLIDNIRSNTSSIIITWGWGRLKWRRFFHHAKSA